MYKIQVMLEEHEQFLVYMGVSGSVALRMIAQDFHGCIHSRVNEKFLESFKCFVIL